MKHPHKISMTLYWSNNNLLNVIQAEYCDAQ
jgi:hypothetical protein